MELPLLMLFISIAGFFSAHELPLSPLFSSTGWQFMDACERGDANSVSNLFEHIDNPMDGLLKACERGHLEVVRKLLSSTSLCKDPVCEPVLVAADKGHPKIVEILVDSGFPIKLESARLIMAMAKSKDIFRSVFKEGRQLFSRDFSRAFQTILFYALRLENMDVIRLALTWTQLHQNFPFNDRLQVIETGLGIAIETLQIKSAAVFISLAIDPRYCCSNSASLQLTRVRRFQEMHYVFCWMSRFVGCFALPKELIVISLQQAFGPFLH